MKRTLIEGGILLAFLATFLIASRLYHWHKQNQKTLLASTNAATSNVATEVQPITVEGHATVAFPTRK